MENYELYKWFIQQSPIMQALYAGLFTWGLTALGAALVFLFKNSSRKALDISLGFTGGVMIAASFWSLLSPSINYIENTTNELFNLNYILDMGKEHNKKLALAVQYLPYLGTDKYTASELQEEFYKLGLRMDVSASSNRSYVSIEGLEK